LVIDQAVRHCAQSAAAAYGFRLRAGTTRLSESRTQPCILAGAKRPRSCKHLSPAKEGVGNAGCRFAPAASRGKNKNHTSVVTTVAPGHPAFPHANGFNGFLRALPGDRAFLSPSLAGLCLASLASASGCRDHTTSPSAAAPFVLGRNHVHRIPLPTSVTIAKRPSCGSGTAGDMDVIWAKREGKYF
jgi:hypothetical protein